MVSLKGYVFVHKTAPRELTHVGVRRELTHIVYMYRRELSQVGYTECELTHVGGILVSLGERGANSNGRVLGGGQQAPLARYRSS
jgi:hypothetical protein